MSDMQMVMVDKALGYIANALEATKEPEDYATALGMLQGYLVLIRADLEVIKECELEK